MEPEFKLPDDTSDDVTGAEDQFTPAECPAVLHVPENVVVAVTSTVISPTNSDDVLKIKLDIFAKNKLKYLKLAPLSQLGSQIAKCEGLVATAITECKIDVQAKHQEQLDGLKALKLLGEEIEKLKNPPVETLESKEGRLRELAESGGLEGEVDITYVEQLIADPEYAESLQLLQDIAQLAREVQEMKCKQLKVELAAEEKKVLVLPTSPLSAPALSKSQGTPSTQRASLPQGSPGTLSHPLDEPQFVTIHPPVSPKPEKVPPPLCGKLALMTRDELKSSIDILSKKPVCAERSIEFLLFYVQLLRRSATESSVDMVAAVTDNEFLVLEKRLKLEKLAVRETNQALEKAQILVKAADWDSATMQLISLLRLLRPFDIMEMQRLWDCSKAAVLRLEDKDIILLLGETGAGKSTTTHFMAGSEMAEVKHSDIEGSSSIRPIKVFNQDLLAVKVGSSTQSETRYVSAVEVQYRDLGIDEEMSVSICDTPGFGDTGGPEVDVANGLGLVDGLRVCKSVRPFVLSSYKDAGGRGQGLKRIAYRMASILPGVRHYLDSFSYAFVRYPQNDNPNATLVDLQKHLSPHEKNDEAYIDVLADMVKKTNSLQDQITIPLLGGRQAAAALLLKLSAKQGIKRPGTIFKFSPQDVSKTAIRAQISKINEAIFGGLERYEFPFVQMKLDELKSFGVLNDQTLIDAYEEGCKTVQAAIKALFVKCRELLSRTIRDANEMTPQDISDYATLLQQLEQTAPLREAHFPESENHVAEIRSFFNKEVEQLADFKEQDLAAASAAARFKKLKQISEQMPAYVQLFVRAQSCVTTRFQELKDATDAALVRSFNVQEGKVAQDGKIVQDSKVAHDAKVAEDGNVVEDGKVTAELPEAKRNNVFDEFAVRVQKLNLISKNFAELLILDAGNQIQGFLDGLAKATRARDASLTQPAPMLSFLPTALNQIATMLEDAGSCINLTGQMSSTMLAQLHKITEGFWDKLKTGGNLENSTISFARFQSLIEEELKKADSSDAKETPSIQKIGMLALDMDKIRSVSPMIKYDPIVDGHYRVLVGRIRNHMLHSMQLVERFFGSMTSENSEKMWDNERFRDLPRMFEELKNNASWMAEFNDGAHKGDLAHLQALNMRSILGYVQKLREDAAALSLDLSASDGASVDGAFNLVIAGRNLTKIKKIIAALAQVQDADFAASLKQEEQSFETALKVVVEPQLKAIETKHNLNKHVDAIESKLNGELARVVAIRDCCDELHQHKLLLNQYSCADIEVLVKKIDEAKKEKKVKKEEFESISEEVSAELEELEGVLKRATRLREGPRTAFLTPKGLTEASLNAKIQELTRKVDANTSSEVKSMELHDAEIEKLEAARKKWLELSKQPNSSPKAMETLQKAGYSGFEALESALRDARQKIRDHNPMNVNFKMEFPQFEVSLQYVEACRNVPCLAAQAATVYLLLKSELIKFSELVRDQITLCLDALIIDPATLHNKMQALQLDLDLSVKTNVLRCSQVKLLSDRLKELKKLSQLPSSSLLAKCFPGDFLAPMLEESLGRLQTYHKGLDTELSNFLRQQEANELHSCLWHVHSLEPLDEFLLDQKKDSVSGELSNFSSLFKKMNDAMRAQVDNLDWIPACTTSHNYVRIAQYMSKLKNTPAFALPFTNAKQQLSAWVNNYLSLTVVPALPSGGILELSKIRAVIGDLKNVGMIKDYVFEYLEQPVQELLNGIGGRDALQQNVNEATDFVEARIRATNYEDAEKRRELLVQVMSALKGFDLSAELQARVKNLPEYVAYRFKLLGEFFEGKEKPSPHEVKLEQFKLASGKTPSAEESARIKDVVESQMQNALSGLDFSRKGFSRYNFVPPKRVLGALANIGLNGQVPDVYLRAESDLTSIVTARFQAAIEELRELRPLGTNITKQRSEVEAGLRSLPESMREDFSTTLTVTINHIQKFESSQQEDLLKALAENDYEQIERQFKEAGQAGLSAFQSDLEHKVVAKSVVQREEVAMELVKSGLLTAFEGMKVLYEYKTRLPHVQRLATQFTLLVREVNVFYDKSTQALIDAFSGAVCAVSNTETAKLSEYFAHVLSFDVLLKPAGEHDTLTSELLPKNFSSKLNTLSVTALRYFGQAMTEKNLAVANMDPEGLQKAIEFFGSWDSFVKKGCQKDFSDLPDMKPIHALGVSLRHTFVGPESLVAMLRGKILEAKKACVVQLLAHPAACGLDAERNKFYHDVNDALQMLLRLKECSTFQLSGYAGECYSDAKDTIAKQVEQSGLTLKTLAERSMSQDDSRKFTLQQKNLSAMQHCMPEFSTLIETSLQQAERSLATQVDAIVKRGESNLTPAELSNTINQLAAMGAAVPMVAERVGQSVDGLLVAFEKHFSNDDATIAFEKTYELSTALSSKPLGQEVGRTHPLFQSCRDRTRVAATKQQDISYVVKKMGGNNVDRSQLTLLYKDFQRGYDKLMESVLQLSPADRILRVQAEIVTTVAGLQASQGSKVNPAPEERVDFTTRMANYLGSFFSPARAAAEQSNESKAPINGVRVLPSTATEYKEPTEQKEPDYKDLEPRAIAWTAEIKAVVQDLMCQLLVLWTLQRSQQVLEKMQNVDSKWLPAPHPVQVVAIFRIMGFGYDEGVPGFTLENTLHEVLTGEGKSLVLGVSAAIFALLGFSVSVASNSSYLSARDFKNFLPLFDCLGMTNHIQYGTFDALCEHTLNEQGKVREQLQKMIAGETVEPEPTENRKTVLLVDEVDVFFSNAFYCNVYNPGADIKHPTIIGLADYIWSIRKQLPTLSVVQASPAYAECKAHFGVWIAVVDEAIKDMVVDLKDFDSATHEYIVDKDRICYKSQDGISDKIVIRYKTLFAYYAEKEKGTISEASWRDHVKLMLVCGSYSYSMIAKYFDRMIGVTGTLQNINPTQMKTIEKDFNFKRHTYLPSAYGPSQRQFFPNTDTVVYAREFHFLKVAAQISSKLSGNKRAVIVCFADRKALMEFWDSKEFQEFRPTAQKMTEEATESEKNSIVIMATRAGQVTLITRAFGRGTDFVTGDPVVKAAGGVHVIQVFVSEDKAEEIQICGRTARQGQEGSYSMIIPEESLELFFGKDLEAEMKAMKDDGKVYDRIDAARNKAFEANYLADKSGGVTRRQMHLKSMQFLVDLRKNRLEQVKDALCGLNKGAAQADGGKVSRTAVLMDATGSMRNLLSAAKTTVQAVFANVCKVLALKGLPTDRFEMQFTVYRNYCCTETDICQSSKWCNQADDLQAFMLPIRAAGGMRNEAIEVGLAHVNSELEHSDTAVSQVILIGDAAPNTPQEVLAKRVSERGEAYWSQTKYAVPTDSVQELAKFQNRTKKVPVHAYYVLPTAQKAFEEIAQATGGKAFLLDVNSKAGAELLTHEVSKAVLRDVAASVEQAAALESGYNEIFVIHSS